MEKKTNPAPKKAPVSPKKPSVLKKTDTAKTISAFLSRGAGKVLTYILNILLTLFLIGIITGSAVACALVVYIKNYVDPVYDIENLKYDSSLTTTVYYESPKEDGSKEWVEWEEERIFGTENRMWVSYSEMPEDLINAFVSIEDKRFFKHKGVDLKRTLGAVLGFISGNDSYGGSTITQQLIKNVTGEADVTIQRKIQEILRAFNLENKRSKEEILEMYLNTIYLSKGCYGVASAANHYFGKSVSELNLVECAALAAIPQNPSRWNPVDHMENNDDRRWVILDQMYKNDDIDKTYTFEEIEEAKNTELVLTQEATEIKTSVVHSWFVDAVIFDVIRDLQNTYNYDEQTAKNMLYSGGLQIYTTVDRDVQNAIDEVYQNDNNFPSQGTGVQVESAMTVIDQTTGNIVGIVGGRGVKSTPLAFNRATMATRQPGSSIKPIAVYVQALEKGLINYSTVVDDTPFRMNAKGDGSNWVDSVWPNNWNNVFSGLCTISTAVRESKNTVAVKVLDMLGTENSYNFMTNRFHFTTLVKADKDYAPLALGGFTNGVTNREICTAYAAIANNGVYNSSKTYVKVLDSAGNVLLDNSPTPEIILSHDSCAVMTKLLQEVVSYGTGTAVTLKKQMDVAAKTGTTTDNNDLYFCGFTPYYTAACWVGYDTPKSLTNFKTGQTRTTPALYLWDQVMTRIHQKVIQSGNVRRFTDYLTGDLVTRTYCKDSGNLVSSACSLDLRGNRTATGYYAKSNLPTGECTIHKLVSYCNETGCVAGVGCTDTRTVALIDVKRVFTVNIPVDDAQYTYVAMPAGVKYPASTRFFYYGYSYTPGTYSGYSATEKPANAYCSLHNPDLCQ